MCLYCAKNAFKSGSRAFFKKKLFFYSPSVFTWHWPLTTLMHSGDKRPWARRNIPATGHPVKGGRSHSLDARDACDTRATCHKVPEHVSGVEDKEQRFSLTLFPKAVRSSGDPYLMHPHPLSPAGEIHLGGKAACLDVPPR